MARPAPPACPRYPRDSWGDGILRTGHRWLVAAPLLAFLSLPLLFHLVYPDYPVWLPPLLGLGAGLLSALVAALVGFRPAP